MARLAVCAVMGFVWERERISDEEALSCLRESEQRRGLPLTESLNITSISKKQRTSKKREALKRSNVVRATPIITPLPASWNSTLQRQRIKQHHQHVNTSALSTSHNTVLHHDTQHHTPQSSAALNSKKHSDNIQETSWWSVVVGYTLGAVYNSYNGVISYFTGVSNTGDGRSEDDCDLNNVLISAEPPLLASQCLNMNSDKTIKKRNALFGTMPDHWVNSTVDKVVRMFQNYVGSPVPISLFEDALIAADYDGTGLLPVGTASWSPQEFSSKSVTVHSEKKDYCNEKWELVHHSNDTHLYVRPYKDTNLSQYRVVSRYDDVTAADFVEVQTDPLLRQQWDSYTGKMRILDTDRVSNSEVLHWEVKFPFPLSNRDYVFIRRCVVLPRSIVVLSKSTQHPSIPPSRHCVRVDNYNSVMIVTAETDINKEGFWFELVYVDDPKCNLPSSISSWASSSGMMEFLAKVHTTALKKKQQRDHKV